MAHLFREGFSLTGNDAELVAALKAIAVKFRPNTYDEEWYQYAVLSLNKFLRDTPPEGSDELRNALAALKADSTHHPDLPTPTESTTGVAQSTPATKNSAPSQKVDTKAQKGATKRPKIQEKAPSFTVHTKGEYTVRVSEGATPTVEFNLNGPATVQIKTAGPSGAASSRPVPVPVDNPSDLRPCGAVPGTYHQMSLFDPTPAPCCASP
ncbi:hypothetical protein N0V85_006969 [Neurospora sp. IMI 360204]|nr:hypothetical protein N0V85_006969 [Neurospora sp. IMI 360204]